MMMMMMMMIRVMIMDDDDDDNNANDAHDANDDDDNPSISEMSGGSRAREGIWDSRVDGIELDSIYTKVYTREGLPA